MEVGLSGQNMYDMIRESVSAQRLRIVEQKVKAHELAHKTVGGELAGAVRYKYTKGPDGRLYVTGGEVPLRLEKGKTPQETVEIANRVKRAALAPLNPSSQDRAVAAKAAAMEIQARIEMMAERNDERNVLNLYI